MKKIILILLTGISVYSCVNKDEAPAPTPTKPVIVKDTSVYPVVKDYYIDFDENLFTTNRYSYTFDISSKDGKKVQILDISSYLNDTLKTISFDGFNINIVAKDTNYSCIDTLSVKVSNGTHIKTYKVILYIGQPEQGIFYYILEPFLNKKLSNNLVIGRNGYIKSDIDLFLYGSIFGSQTSKYTFETNGAFKLKNNQENSIMYFFISTNKDTITFKNIYTEEKNKYWIIK